MKTFQQLGRWRETRRTSFAVLLLALASLTLFRLPALAQPAGATYAPITETVNGLTAYATTRFLPAFPSGGTLGSASFGPQVVLSAGNGPACVAIGDLDRKSVV